MAQAIQANNAQLEAGLPSDKVEDKGFSRLDIVELVSKVARLLEDTTRLQNLKRESLLEQKERHLTNNIKAVRSKGYTSAAVAAISILIPIKNPETAPVVGAIAPTIQQTIDGAAPSWNINGFGLGSETRRVEAELLGAHADQEIQQITTDTQKSRETAQGFESAVRSAATFYGR